MRKDRAQPVDLALGALDLAIIPEHRPRLESLCHAARWRTWAGRRSARDWVGPRGRDAGGDPGDVGSAASRALTKLGATDGPPNDQQEICSVLDVTFPTDKVAKNGG